MRIEGWGLGGGGGLRVVVLWHNIWAPGAEGVLRVAESHAAGFLELRSLLWNGEVLGLRL